MPFRRLAGRIAFEGNFRGRYRIANWLSAGRPVVRVGTGLLELELGDYVSDQIFAHGIYEPLTHQLAQRLCKREMNFIDVGAHIGLYSVPLAANGCNVISLEPNIRTFRSLCRNVSLNRLENKIITISCGVAERAELKALYQSCLTNSGGSSFNKDGSLANYAAVLPLDNIIEITNFQSIELLKIDVEGREIDVIKTLGVYKPRNIILEWNGHSKVGLVSEFLQSDIYDLTFELGYECFDVRGIPVSSLTSFVENNVHLYLPK